MKTRIVGTHLNGKRLSEREINSDVPAEGNLSLYRTTHGELRREVSIATCTLDLGMPNEKQLLPPLYQPEILTLGSRLTLGRTSGFNRNRTRSAGMMSGRIFVHA